MRDAVPLPNWQANPSELEPFGRIRLIAVDLDGSFVHANSHEVQDLIGQLSRGLSRGRGSRPAVRLTYATGRSLTWVNALLAEKRTALPSGTPMVLYNGSVVVEAQTNRVLSRVAMDAAALAHLRTVALDLETTLFVYTGPERLLDGTVEQVLGAPRPPVVLERDINGAPIHWDASEDQWATAEPVAVLLDCKPQRLPELLSRLRRINGISVTSSGAGFVEVRPQNTNKATGLEVVVEKLGLCASEVLALGDNDNDVEMLEWAGVGVAVAGASHRLLASSDYVCRFGAAAGAIEVLRTVKHARKYFGTGRAPLAT